MSGERRVAGAVDGAPAARPGKAGQIVVAQIADGQLPGAVAQDHLAQTLERSPVKPHSRIL
jgi:hypothetical protein